MNNPVNLVDFNGKEPSTYEAAIMSGYVYHDKKDFSMYQNLLSETEWTVSEKQTSITMNYNGIGENGLQSMLFERTIDGVKEYVYAFAGTNSFEDCLEDMAQLAGVAPQYSAAIGNARTLSAELGDTELTFVGHSLGGGEAAAASMATNRCAITFNRSSVSKLTQLKNGLGSTRNVKNVITKTLDSSGNYVMEPLSNFQNTKIFGIPLLRTNGRTEFIRINRQLGPIDAHSINTVVKHLRK